MTRYAVGDLHGRFDLLDKALDLFARLKKPGDEFIVLGDFVDRGPDSAKIIEMLRQQPRYIIALKGNHEDMMVRCLRRLAPLPWWIGNGGGRTLMSYGYQQGDDLRPLKVPIEDDLEWLDNLPVYYDTPAQLFVHAGVEPGVPLSQQDPDRMMWQLYDRHKNRRPDDRDHNDTNYEKHVVHGHEQWAHGPILLKGRTDLDTFAWLTGRLAVGVFEETQGPPVEILWVEGEPYENGSA